MTEDHDRPRPPAMPALPASGATSPADPIEVEPSPPAALQPPAAPAPQPPALGALGANPPAASPAPPTMSAAGTPGHPAAPAIPPAPPPVPMSARLQGPPVMASGAIPRPPAIPAGVEPTRRSIAESMTESFATSTAGIDPYATAQIPLVTSDMGASTAMAAVATTMYEPSARAGDFGLGQEAPEFASIFEPDEDEDMVLPRARGAIAGLIAAAAVLIVIIWFTVPSVQDTFKAQAASATKKNASTTFEIGSIPFASISFVDRGETTGPDVAPELAIDGDVDTSWKSYSYPTTTLAKADQFGLALKLKQVTTVSEIQLVVYGSGGMAEVRAATAAKPTQGTVLASSELSPKTRLTFSEPVETDTITIWFTAMPTAQSDGKFWIDLGEIGAS